MIKFPSIEAADAWYASAEYAPLKALRQNAGTFNVVFIYRSPRVFGVGRWSVVDPSGGGRRALFVKAG